MQSQLAVPTIVKWDMQSLIDAFHCLRGFKIVWDEANRQPALTQLRAIKRGPHADSERLAAAFVLYVYNYANKFDFHRAMSCWDHHQMAAFVAWAADKWWK